MIMVNDFWFFCITIRTAMMRITFYTLLLNFNAKKKNGTTFSKKS